MLTILLQQNVERWLLMLLGRFYKQKKYVQENIKTKQQQKFVKNNPCETIYKSMKQFFFLKRKNINKERNLKDFELLKIKLKDSKVNHEIKDTY